LRICAAGFPSVWRAPRVATATLVQHGLGQARFSSCDAGVAKPKRGGWNKP
jgi:hypothetical protein